MRRDPSPTLADRALGNDGGTDMGGLNTRTGAGSCSWSIHAWENIDSDRNGQNGRVNLERTLRGRQLAQVTLGC